MILTPIPFAHVPEVLARFAGTLEDRLARTVFARLALPDAARRAEGAAARGHRRVALRLAAGFGMGLVPGSPRAGCSWDGRAIRTGTEAYVLLHELAHFQLAPPERRRLVDFGLGPGPETGDTAAAAAAQRLFGIEREREEAMASLLGILWENELGHPALASMLDQNWLEGAGRPGAANHFESIIALLRDAAFISREGRPTRHMRPR